MPAQFIVNQDRDQIYKFDPNALIYTAPIVHNNVLYGLNLMMGNRNLGTFDSPEEVVNEVSAIYNSNAEIHPVSGYSTGGFAEW